jgi:two-component system OmpR family response regulator
MKVGRAVLRRTGPATATRLRVADLELDEDSHQVRRDGTLIALTPTEFRLLWVLMLIADRVLSKDPDTRSCLGLRPVGDGNVVGTLRQLPAAQGRPR